jgi:signal transduction histidine kinase
MAVNRLINDRDQYDPENLRESVEEVVSLGEDTIEGLNQISELVLSLKDFSRLDRAAQDRFNLREGIEKTLTITRNLLKYGVEVETHFEEVEDIFCSPSRVNQIFINLVTNAVQAMDGKGKLTISVSQRDDWVDVTFEDTGCGIPEENLSKIMDPFFTTKPVGQGTGLGLSIVRQIVEEHQGQVLVDSKVGHGTRITIGLPVRRQEDEEAA